MNRIRLIFAFILALSLTLFLGACTDNSQTPSTPTPSNEIPNINNGDELHDWAKEYSHLGTGLTLGVVNDHELTYDGVVFLDKITDTLNVQFANLTDTSSEYVLKVFYDYEEVSFSVNGSDTFVSDHIFTVNTMTSLIIPIMLDDNLSFDNSHLLTIAILTAPNKHAVDLDMMSNSYGVCSTYELANRNETRQINAKPTAIGTAMFLEITYQGLMLNTDFDAKDDNQVFFPPKEIKTGSGETVRLAYRAGNYDENTGDVLFIVLVDWQQQGFNDNPFIYISNNPGYMGYGEIEITAPIEQGKYDITGFIVRNPYELRNADIFELNDTCYRFTLVVE